MRRVAAVLVALVVVSAVAPGAGAAAPRLGAAVVGGTPAPATFTFVAALLRPGTGAPNTRHFCGGALVAPTWVVTAAHCAQALQGRSGGLVVLGRADLLGTGGEEHAIEAVHRFPGWTGAPGTGGDIALLELVRPSAIPPAPLLREGEEPVWDGALRQGTVAGWGYTVATGSAPSTVLLAARLPVLPEGQCQQFLGPGADAAGLLCGGNAQASACAGDSGGPLLVTDTRGRLAVAGVSSFGPRVCGQSPSFYSRIAGFADWLAETMGPVTAPPEASPPAYSLLAVDGTVHSFGAPSLGNAGACRPARSCTDLAARPGGGYWLSRGTCEVSAFGPAPAVAAPATEERCAITAASGRGLWALTPSGRVFALGGARALGQARPRARGAWLQIQARPQGDGFWLLASDGAVSGFGAARALPASGGRLSAPVANLAPTTSGLGYWLVGRDGSVAAFGDARSHGAAAGRRLVGPIVDIQPTATGAGYWLFGADGAVHAFGDAEVAGSALRRAGPIVAAVRRSA